MTGRVFVDSNVLIYAHDLDSGDKQPVAKAGRGNLGSPHRVLEHSGAASVASEVVCNYAAWVHVPLTPATVVRASEISEIWRLSFWDGMIVAAAEQEGAEILLTEDFSAGQRIAGMHVVDPFLS